MELKHYSDLNLSINSAKDNTDGLWERLHDLYLRNVAFNTTIVCSATEEKKKKKNDKLDDPIPPPAELRIPQKFAGKMTALRRITIQYSDPSEWYKVSKSPNLRKYHIVAVSPESQAALQHACSCPDVDLITYEPEERPPWKMTKKLYNMAVERNIFFELKYAPAIIDSTCRKNIIQTSHLYYTVGKCKNVVVSSGTTKQFNLRSPYDIINLCAILGMEERPARDSIWTNPRFLIARSRNRRLGKSVIKLSQNSDGGPEDSAKGPRELTALKEDNK